MPPTNAAQAVVHALNLPRLREQLFKEIQANKAEMRAAYDELRMLYCY